MEGITQECKIRDNVNPNLNKNSKKRIAMYVIYDKDGILDEFRKYYLKELRKQVDCILAVVSGTLTAESRDELEKLTDDILVRENVGLLAYSWIEGIQHIGWETLDKYDELLMLNDSFFGPFFPLQEMFDDMEKSNADFYGSMKNFEEKSYTSIAGRAMKHDHFMGSIPYFYVIRDRLLHSREFRNYWSKKPPVKQDWDTYFFAEIDFYQYVLDAGFKIESYQSDKLKGYFFDNLTHNMSKLISGDRIPFARIRPFGTDMKDQSQQVNYGKDPRETFEYIEKNTNYDTNMMWDYLLRTKNLTDIYNQMQLEYVVSRDNIEKPFSYNKKIGVIIHIYYKDQVNIIADYSMNFPANTDFYITTTSEDKKEVIDKAFSTRKLNYFCKVRPNVGVAMSTLWVTYADIIKEGEYEYLCYFHDKKSPYAQFQVQGEQFAERCYQNLMGTTEIVKNIINTFEENSKLGILGAPVVYHSAYFMVALRSYSGNYHNVLEFAKKLNLKVDIKYDKVPVAPYGDMFWFRADAMKKAIAHDFTYDDFDIEYKPDFTILHAIERCYGYIAQDAGYYYAEVINNDDARSDLVNYRYMLEEIGSILTKRGFIFNDYEELKHLLYMLNPNEKLVHKYKAKKFLQYLLSSPNSFKYSLGLFLQKTYRRWFKKK